MRRFIGIVLLVIAASGFGCSTLTETPPGICLSFDDRNLEQWVEILPLLAEYEANVTFFINGVGELSEAEKAMIHQIQNGGHEIQAHGEHHFSMNSYVSANGFFDYFEKEITEHLAAFKEIGIKPTVFAYPFGEKNHYIDLFLWPRFSATRNVSSKKEDLDKVEEIYYKIGEQRFNFFSLGIDESDNLTEDQIEIALQRALSNREILFLHAHEIGGNGTPRISKMRLKWLLESGTKSGLKFYRYTDLLKK